MQREIQRRRRRRVGRRLRRVADGDQRGQAAQPGQGEVALVGCQGRPPHRRQRQRSRGGRRRAAGALGRHVRGSLVVGRRLAGAMRADVPRRVCQRRALVGQQGPAVRQTLRISSRRALQPRSSTAAPQYTEQQFGQGQAGAGSAYRSSMTMLRPFFAPGVGQGRAGTGGAHRWTLRSSTRGALGPAAPAGGTCSRQAPASPAATRASDALTSASDAPSAPPSPAPAKARNSIADSTKAGRVSAAAGPSRSYRPATDHASPSSSAI